MIIFVTKLKAQKDAPCVVVCKYIFLIAQHFSALSYTRMKVFFLIACVWLHSGGRAFQTSEKESNVD